jgi:gluconate kinase
MGGRRRRLKLPLEFDGRRLQADLSRILPDEFLPHFNADYYEGDWSAAPLRSVGGQPDRIFPDPTAKQAFADTPLLGRCPYLRQVIASFECPVLAARLLRLGPGSVINEHRDPDLGLDVGEIRVHVPVATNPRAAFFLDGEPAEMQEGECWYLDFSLPHRAANHGTTDRIHLVVDLVVNDWLKGVLDASTEGPATGPRAGETAAADGATMSDLDHFRALVMRDAPLAQRLLEVEEGDAFLSLAMESATAAGFSLSAADVEVALRRPATREADDGIDPGSLGDWTPFRVGAGLRPVVEWLHLGRLSFTEPFFRDTIAQRVHRPLNRFLRPRTGMEALAARHRAHPGLEPTGFIFHASRCGSTLVSRMLATLSSAIVVSEAEPIDSVLRVRFRDPRITDEDRVRWLRGMVGALGRRRLAEERLFFLKLDAWSAMDLPLFRSAFPDVPWAFLYRDPVEVLASHARRRGQHMVPGLLEPELFGLSPADVPRMPIDEYGARVLAAIGQAALDHRTGTTILVSYRDLPGAVTSTLLPFFGVEVRAEEAERMRDVALFHAKEPGRRFSADAEATAAVATPSLRQAAARWPGPVFERLEAHRLGD